MPYGISKDLGGDNDKNDKWMEDCVSSVMKGGKGKDTAVAICKAQMRKSKMKKQREEQMKSSIENTKYIPLYLFVLDDFDAEKDLPEALTRTKE
jgi:hypothetical protein